MTTTNLSAADLAAALDQASEEAARRARVEDGETIKAKIVEMLDWRKRGLLKASGDDFLSGMVAAWELITDRKWSSEPGSAVCDE